MNKFIKTIIGFSLKNKYFIFFTTFLLILAGYFSFKKTTIEAFPDVTNTSVTIITQWPGRSAEEVEKFVTRPLEIAMNPTEKRTSIRSSSAETCFSSLLKMLQNSRTPEEPSRTSRPGRRRTRRPSRCRTARPNSPCRARVPRPCRRRG